MNIAWHFTSDKLRDGSPIPAIGEKLIFNGKIEICKQGYHWSKEPFDALRYSPGNMLHMVEYGGDIQEKKDKGCSSERTILKSLDATYLLRRFAADQALSVAYLWDMPEVVKEYLTTLNETNRAAARAAANSAAYAPYAPYAAAPYAAYAAAAYAAAAYASNSAARAADVRVGFNRRVYEAFNN